MSKLAWNVAAALLLTAGVVGANAAAPKKPAAIKPVKVAPVNWSSQIRVTENGAFLLGNPAAPVRLIEYISYTCSHCAHFVGEASGPLKTGYVAKGTTAVELRNAVRDPFDLTAALLARCGGAKRVFGNSEAIMATQEAWLKKAAAYDGSATPEASVDDRLRAIAKATGLDVLMRGRGYSPAQIDACLTDQRQQETLRVMAQKSFERISGTPSFELNGTVVDGVHDWTRLEPKLQAALAR